MTACLFVSLFSVFLLTASLPCLFNPAFRFIGLTVCSSACLSLSCLCLPSHLPTLSVLNPHLSAHLSVWLPASCLSVCCLSFILTTYYACPQPTFLSVSLTVYPSVCLPVHMPVVLFSFQSAYHVCPRPCLFAHLTVCPSTCLYVCLFFVALHSGLLTLSIPNAAYLTTCQSVCLTVCPLACLPDCLSIFIFFPTCLPNLSPSTPSVCLTAYLPRGFETGKIGLHEGRQTDRQKAGSYTYYFLSVVVCIRLKKISLVIRHLLH